MKKLIRSYLISIAALSFTAYAVPGIQIEHSLDGLLLVTLVFTIMNRFVKPLLKVLSLPIEIATLGMFTLIINTFLFVVVDYLLLPITIEGFWFPGFTWGPVLIAPIALPGIVTAMVGSFLISIVESILLWLND